MSGMYHGTDYKMKIFPIEGTAVPAQIDRAQSVDPTATMNREPEYELGRDTSFGLVGYIKKTPNIAYRMVQNEYGNIEFWQKLICNDILGNIGQSGITLNSFKTPYFDIGAYLLQADSSMLGTLVYPAMRVSGFSINIGEPDGKIERNFDLVGEEAQFFYNANKYYIFDNYDVASGGDDEIDLSAIAPEELPNDSGNYIFKVYRIRAGVTTKLVLTTDYTYSNATKILTLVSAQAGDKIKYSYTSATAPASIFTANDSDVPGILGDSVDIYLYNPQSGAPSSSDYAYRLQSVNLNVSLDRADLKELGNKNVVQRGIDDATVTVSFSRKLETVAIDEVLAGVSSGHGQIDISEFVDTNAVIVKVYSDNTKTTFKYGFLMTGMTASDNATPFAVQEFGDRATTLEGKNMTISADTSVLGI